VTKSRNNLQDFSATYCAGYIPTIIKNIKRFPSQEIH